LISTAPLPTLAGGDGSNKRKVVSEIGWIGLIAGLALLLLVSLLVIFVAKRRSQSSTIPSDDLEPEEMNMTTVTEDNTENELEYENPLMSGDEFGSDSMISSDYIILSDDADEGIVL
jgi:hypothetical protein